MDESGAVFPLTTQNKIESNSGDLLKNMAIQGHGIAYLPSFLVYDAIVDGSLIELLPHYQLPELHLYAAYPNNRFLSQRARALIDFINEHCADKPYWELQPR